ncbi:MlaD family protein [Limimaricola pyoseonensis]|uniref:Paraquat-inducible protein B n=1 Tax=Limimaricola pyoseonensis TaxID=521013 RepID=A0A1G6ZJ08_9RHOB|nr:MlaD family protein [Limimaricola pyoseonensis]SDE02491.1 Paraquat-inducible protein B [Limimaricola pyoseonensis]
MSDGPPEVPLEAGRRPLRERVSVVWLVPAGALAVALGIAWQQWSQQGPLIEVIFDDAAGVMANETELRFRDVAVGIVEEVGFTENLEQVRVSIRVDKGVAEYIDEAADFWVVRPEVTTEGVSGLETVLSGVYIRGQWDTEAGGTARRFEGLPRAPLLGPDQDGIEIVMRASEGVLSGNSPILYKGVEAGRIGEAGVSTDGFYVEAPAVIYAPYDTLVTETTRFWDTSGFSVKIGTGGAEIDFDSVAALLAGGLAFDTFVSGATLAEDGQTFEVYDSEETARNSVFNTPDGPSLNLVAVFDGNVSGLAVGAPVELDGVRIGSVSGLNGLVDEQRFGDRGVRLQTVLTILPSRLGMAEEGGVERALQYFIDEVEEGLRARLVTGSILTGGLKVQLLDVPGVEPDVLDPDALPYPAIPVTQSEISDVQATAQGTLDRINNLPIEELLASATSFLENAARLIGSEDLQQTPADVRALLGDIRGIVGSDEVQAVPGQIGSVMGEIELAVSGIREILDDIRAQEAVSRILAAVDSANAVTADLDTALDGVPELIGNLNRVAETAADLPFDTLLSEVSGLAEQARALVGSEETQALPGRVNALLAELETGTAEARQLVASLNEGQAVTRLLETVDAAGAAVATLDRSLEGVPQLVSRLDTLAATANELPLDTLMTRVSGLADEARRLIGSEDTQALPGRVNALLAELETGTAEARTLIASLNEEQGVTRLLDTIDAAGQAAATLDRSLEGVPQLVSRIDAVAATAQELPLELLFDRVSGLADEARALIGTEAARELPGRIGTLAGELERGVAEARELLAEVNEGGGGESLVAAIDSAARAADSLDRSFAGVPQLVDNLNAVAGKAADLPLEVLVAEATSLVNNADRILAQDTARALPGELNGALDELRQILGQVREGGVVENANATFASAANAADQLAAAAESLPALVSRAEALLLTADGTVGVIGDETTPALRDLRAALREVTQAADAVESLARAIERRPNSLLTGR